MTVVVGVLSSVIAALLLAVLGLLWRQRRRAVMMPGAAWRRVRAKARARQLRHLRQRVLDRAREVGIAVPLSASGGSPRVVTWSNGSPDSYFYRELASYRRACRAGVRRWRARPGTPSHPSQ